MPAISLFFLPSVDYKTDMSQQARDVGKRSSIRTRPFKHRGSNMPLLYPQC